MEIREVHKVELDTTTDKKPASSMKKWLRNLLKGLAIVVIAIVVFIAVVFFVDLFSSKSEQAKLLPYGQSVTVDGKYMNVSTHGEGEETIVLLPGYGTAAPALDFKPLIEQLSPFYKVVVIEPFGYGLSDLTDKERSTENIVSEIHDVLQSLQIDRYILMGHSISGIYGLDYVNKYPSEVSAFVGLDSSVPTLKEQKIGSSILGTLNLLKKTGFARLQLKIGDDPYAELPYDDQTKEQLKILIHKNIYNANQLNEAGNMYANFEAAEHLTFPKALPVMFFIQANHPVTDRWIPEHEKQIKDSVHGKMVLFEADHYLYRTHSTEIVENLRTFMEQVKQDK
ncbi:Pimeloyl-ACP methyl ester carboxylesterase [Paenibacillus algorifonticola]|uniref:Pimeloyl-ACP methyl ester carboxylesterase n=1 Tax=Paenibacillus algorifonticola TaxID=684063 RepID=A0A1I2D3A5_9BACL|nr:Pimeloyl-ACP methyl ester carboxylesterase [Paenibacillus algorifonticola]